MVSLVARGRPHRVDSELIGRVSLAAVPENARGDVVRVVNAGAPTDSPDGYLAVIMRNAVEALSGGTPSITECSTSQLEEGDIVSINPAGIVSTLIRRSSRHKTLFVTDRCNCLCLTCPQPPRLIDEPGNLARLLRIISLLDRDTAELGISGGEPTLLAEELLGLVATCRDQLPATALHILSNGRRFSERSYARALGALRHPDLMIGITLYSDLDDQHDYLVQAKRAFDETVVGLCNLAQADVPVEIRIVVNRDNYRRLPQLAYFIYRNLTFAAHVAFMALEVTGLAAAHSDILWVDPLDYMPELETSVLMLAGVGVTVSVYNHQLCTLPRTLWPYNRQSISDWKVTFLPECDACSAKRQCGGFFPWGLHNYRSKGIMALP